MLCIHVSVHYLTLTLERSDAHLDGPGEVVTCYRQLGCFISVLCPKEKERHETVECSVTKLGHPVNLTRCNLYKPLFTSTSKCYCLLSILMYFMNMAVEL
jgi:hypothetical protein